MYEWVSHTLWILSINKGLRDSHSERHLWPTVSQLIRKPFIYIDNSYWEYFILAKTVWNSKHINWDDAERKLRRDCQNCWVADWSMTLQFTATFKVYHLLYIRVWYYMDTKDSVTICGSNVTLITITLCFTMHFVPMCVLLKQFTLFLRLKFILHWCNFQFFQFQDRFFLLRLQHMLHVLPNLQFI
jgi:hypothetical protein